MNLPMLRRERSHLFPLSWDPFENLFESLREAVPGFQSISGEEYQPPINLYEQDGKLVVTAEVPGMSKEDIEITLDNNLLTLTGKKPPQKEEKGISYYLRESPDEGSFSRCLRLPEEVDPGKIKASVKEGLLTVTMEKKTGPQPKKVEIQ